MLEVNYGGVLVSFGYQIKGFIDIGFDLRHLHGVSINHHFHIGFKHRSGLERNTATEEPLEFGVSIEGRVVVYMKVIQ